MIHKTLKDSIVAALELSKTEDYNIDRTADLVKAVMIEHILYSAGQEKFTAEKYFAVLKAIL